MLPVVVSVDRQIVDKELSEKLFSLDYADVEGKRGLLRTIEGLDRLNEIALEWRESHCNEIRDVVERRTEKLIDIRISSLQHTYKVLIDQIDEFMRNQSDPRILRMKQSQKENLVANRKKQLEELDSKRSINVEVEEIAGGILHIESPA